MPPTNTRFARAVAVAAVFALLGTDERHIDPRDACAITAPDTGSWTPAHDFPSIDVPVVHMLLVPPDTSTRYAAKILWWNGEKEYSNASLGGVLGWQTLGLSPTQPVDSCLKLIADFPDAGFNYFCSGHVQLADGRGVFVAGGTEAGKEIGLPNGIIYDTQANAWDHESAMSYRRWYPSTTSLSDGRVLVSSGSSYPHILTFGGREIGATRPDSLLRRFGPTLTGTWDASVGSAAGHPTYTTWPGAREGHTLTTIALQGGGAVDALFGGQIGPITFLNDVQFFYRDNHEVANDFGYHFVDMNPAHPVPERADHTLVTADDGSAILYGGRGDIGGSIVFGDVRQLFKEPGTCCSWGWRQRDTTGTGPGPRFDHVALFDEVHHRMLVFGGRSSVGGGLADNEIYSLDLTDVADSLHTLTWSKPLVTGSKPSARSGASIVVDPEIRTTTTPAFVRHAIMFGGVTNADTTNQLWELIWSSDASPDSLRLHWRQVNAVDSNMVPRGREEHVSVWDKATGVAVLGGNATGAGDDSVWTFKLPVADNDVLSATWSPDWKKHDPASPHGVAGAAGVVIGQPNFSRKSEIYDPSDDSWSVLSSSQLLEDWYPMHFLVPDGTVFTAGPRDTSYRLNLSTGQWTKHPSGSGSYAGFFAGSAVQYRPGKIMRCGSKELSLSDSALGATSTIDLNQVSPTWHASGNMIGRINHNLVILPTGEVLVTGGMGVGDQRDSSQARRRPQLWSPDADVWYMQTALGESLAREPVLRDYHSVALLLPDARVLTAGGNEDAFDREQFAIFSPPYLYYTNGTPAFRPTIVDAPTVAAPGCTITVCVSGISGGTQKFCLIRPGAPTHGFDQNQRYVPLTPENVCAGKFQMVIPNDADIVPPGDYMLFHIRADGVPSVATWLRIDLGASCPTNTCGCSGGCPYVDVNTTDGWRTENTILGRSQEGALAYDAYRLKLAPDGSSGSIRLRLRENEQEVTTLDEARLLAVDHTPGFKVMGSENGVVAGTWTPAWRVTTSRGEDITSLLSGVDNGGLGWQGSTGDTVLVELDAPRIGMSAAAVQEEGGGTFGGDPKEEELRYEPGGSGSASLRPAVTPTLATDTDWLRSTGVIIQRPDDAGGWVEAAHWYPRQYADESYVPGYGHGVTRLIFIGSHRLTALGRLVPAASGTTVTTLAPTVAAHSRLGSVTDQIAAGGETTTLAPGDTVNLTFSPPAPVEGKAREYVLITRGVYTSNLGTNRMTPSGPGIPSQFALLQNRPNPFGQATTIQFELPVRTRVKLEIFDLLGRRIRTLTNQEWPAGYHHLDWDRRSDSGQLVSAGVFSYRITAGSFRKTHKMVLLAR